jgi:hypothetical protein
MRRDWIEEMHNDLLGPLKAANDPPGTRCDEKGCSRLVYVKDYPINKKEKKNLCEIHFVRMSKKLHAPGKRS